MASRILARNRTIFVAGILLSAYLAKTATNFISGRLAIPVFWAYFAEYGTILMAMFVWTVIFLLAVTTSSSKISADIHGYEWEKGQAKER